MYSGRLVFSQVTDTTPSKVFSMFVSRYGGDKLTKTFSCLDQFRCMAFAQLTQRESLRDTVLCLNALKSKLYHMGIRGNAVLSTLADANERRDWQIYADLAQFLIAEARPLYADDDIGIALDNTVYALDSSTVDLCLSVFPWAKFRTTKSAVKMHRLLDLRGNIPSFIHITDGKVADVTALDKLVPEPSAIYIMDRGYIDFSRLYKLHQSLSFFVVRAKSNIKFQRRYSREVDKSTGLRSDQSIVLTGRSSRADYPEILRRVVFNDLEHNVKYVYFTNNWNLPALDVARLYKARWQVELFFKWIKQHLRIKKFYGYSENAVKTQIWIAVCVYVQVAILKKRLMLNSRLYSILQFLSVASLETIPISSAFADDSSQMTTGSSCNQLSLWDL